MTADPNTSTEEDVPDLATTCVDAVESRRLAAVPKGRPSNVGERPSGTVAKRPSSQIASKCGRAPDKRVLAVKVAPARRRGQDIQA